MKKTARMIAIALALGICLSSMPLAIAEEETSAVTETQVVEEKKEEKAEKHEEAKEEVKEEKHEEAKEEPKAEPEAEVKEEAEVEIEAEPEAEAETEVGTEPETEVETEEFVEIEDEETPLGLFDQQTPFTGSVKLERKGEGNLYFGDEVTLTANVQNANKLYEIRWEVNRQNEEGWTTISGENGTDYDFVLTQENANFEYRVVLVTEA